MPPSHAGPTILKILENKLNRKDHGSIMSQNHEKSNFIKKPAAEIVTPHLSVLSAQTLECADKLTDVGKHPQQYSHEAVCHYFYLQRLS